MEKTNSLDGQSCRSERLTEKNPIQNVREMIRQAWIPNVWPLSRFENQIESQIII